MTEIETIEKMRTLQEKYLDGEKPEDDLILQEFYNTPEYKALSYQVRNRGFVTSHKLMDFLRCGWCYAQKYINEIPDPNEGEDVKEAFTIGLALDDLLTDGEGAFKQKYEVVARRSAKATKTQLTIGQGKIVQQCFTEFNQQPMFNAVPKKRIILHKLANGVILKAELDDINDTEHMIKDIKTCANITTFNPAFYLIQATFYNILVELKFSKNYEVMLEVVDKNRNVSRSGAWIFKETTIRPERHRIIDAIEELGDAMKTGIFPSQREQELLYDCPYYGYKGHGRPTQPFYY